MSQLVMLLRGKYRGKEFVNETFELVEDIKEGKRGHFIKVAPNTNVNFEGVEVLRIAVNPEDVKYIDASGAPRNEPVKASVPEETDEEVMERIGERFDILHEMTRATMTGDVRAMIVVGPPGVGKSYGVVRELEKNDLFNNIRQVKPNYEIIKGAMTPIGLYATLFKYSDKNNVLVFDDCDSIFMDDLALNILKAALDSSKKRRIYWNSDSSYLRKEGIPDAFDFHGSAIFITNLAFENIKSKKLQDHLRALESRCHYIDLTMKSERDKYLRIRQIHQTGELFDGYQFQEDEGDQVVEFMGENAERLREMSLRAALKIADLIKISPQKWKRLAETTVMKNSF